MVLVTPFASTLVQWERHLTQDGFNLGAQFGSSLEKQLFSDFG